MMRFMLTEILLAMAVCGAAAGEAASKDSARGSVASGEFSGSASCRQCHGRFYELWAPSHHGLAMQPYTSQFARENLTPQTVEIAVGASRYRAEIQADEGWVRETGPSANNTYPIVHVLGGKNVYYFLTPYKRGRLQTLPVAYDVHKKLWFDTAASGVRHFPGPDSDEPVHWTDPFYTFNTSCHGCHVSQLSTNYDLKTDTYDTAWAEPGINCETCHGPADRHVKLYRQAAATGEEPKELGLISTRSFSAGQTNSMCNSCHAKLSSISAGFTPGQEYFDHFNLIALEHPDFYPDGRDLGENYTMTSWRMSPCVKSGRLDCMHCHTSSGRYRFADRPLANDACKPCHTKKTEDVEAHAHHRADGEAGKCIACHMPMTKFAHMNRSDHSMRPPAPAATLAFESPNACNLCHADQDAAWADKYVRDWYGDVRQREMVDMGRLIDHARRQNWADLDKMLRYISDRDRDEIFAVSLIRLLRACDSPKKWPVIIRALKEDPSPLVRAGAAETLDGYLTPESVEALMEAAGDTRRLVRVRAAAALVGIASEGLPDKYRKVVTAATAEYLGGLQARADDYTNHYNLGNFYLARGQTEQAIRSFETAIKLRPDYLASHVNVAFAYNAAGRNDKAEASFRKALELDPNSVPVYLNLGMLLAEKSRLDEAKEAFRRALRIDPNSAVAAYNLGVILAPSQPTEALNWCGRAHRLRPDDPKYGYTYAYYLYQGRQVQKAVDVLESMVARKVPHGDTYGFLGAIYQQQGRRDEAIEVYRAAANNDRLSADDRGAFEMMIRRLR